MPDADAAAVEGEPISVHRSRKLTLELSARKEHEAAQRSAARVGDLKDSMRILPLQIAHTKAGVQERSSLARALCSLHVLLPVSGMFVVALTGSLALSISWTVSLTTAETVAEKLRMETIEVVASRIIGVTDSVMELSTRGALGAVGQSRIGCCSPASVDATHVNDFPAVRQYLWENLRTVPHLTINYVGTLAGSLLLYSRTQTGSGAQGGGLTWTVSDATTNYSYHSYTSNEWTSGGFTQAFTSTCGASSMSITSATACGQTATCSPPQSPWAAG